MSSLSLTPLSSSGLTVAPIASVYSSVVNVKTDFGAKGDNSTDDTTAIQAAIASHGPGDRGIVFFPSGQYLFSQLKVPQGVSLIGTGMGSTGHEATTLIQPNGTNLDAIINDPGTIADGDAWHWSQFKDFRLIKPVGTTDTVGSGIRSSGIVGEGWMCERVYIQRFPESGIELQRGGVPTYMRDIHVFSNGLYGIDLVRTAAENWQMVHLDVISGDNNGIALIRLKKAGGSFESFHFSNIKAETSTAGKQLDCIVLEDTNNAPVQISHCAVQGNGVTMNSFVRVETSGATVLFTQPRGSGVTNLIDDNAYPRDLAYSANYLQFGYSTNSTKNPVWGLRSDGLEVGGGTPITQHLTGTATWDPASIADGAMASTIVTVTSASVGDTVAVGFSNAIAAGGVLSGSVTASNTVTVTLFNKTGGNLDLASGTVRADVWKH